MRFSIPTQTRAQGLGFGTLKTELRDLGLGFGTPRQLGAVGLGFGTPKQNGETWVGGWLSSNGARSPMVGVWHTKTDQGAPGLGFGIRTGLATTPCERQDTRAAAPPPSSLGARASPPHLNHGHTEVGIDKGCGAASLHRAQLEKEQKYEPWPCLPILL